MPALPSGGAETRWVACIPAGSQAVNQCSSSHLGKQKASKVTWAGVQLLAVSRKQVARHGSRFPWAHNSRAAAAFCICLFLPTLPLLLRAHLLDHLVVVLNEQQAITTHILTLLCLSNCDGSNCTRQTGWRQDGCSQKVWMKRWSTEECDCIVTDQAEQSGFGGFMITRPAKTGYCCKSTW